MNDLRNTPADKDYKPSGISRAESRALEFYPMKDYNKEPIYIHSCDSKMLDEVYRQVFMLGYEQAEKDVKDTLLEWAKQKQYESLTIVADNFWQEVIDKLNEM